MARPPRGTVDEPIIIGDPGNGNKCIRVVHISDTHTKHDQFRSAIPEGDILIHSGDFAQYGLSQYVFKERDYLNEIRTINKFFEQLPHRYKIFVAGNHDMNFTCQPRERTHKLLTNGLYLQDSWVVIEGIKVYGSPWNFTRAKSWARGFAAPCSHIGLHWSHIPEDVDILVTHQHPLYATRPARTKKMIDIAEEGLCLHCGKKHDHPDLLQVSLNQIRPKLHLFGHIHSDNGVTKMKDTIYCNAAMAEGPLPKVIDIYTTPESTKNTDLEPQSTAPSNASQYSQCRIM